MIRINLLPFRIARKKENIRRQISVFLLLILLTVVALVWYTITVNKQILTVKEKTNQVNSQISKYKEKADRVAKIKKDLKVLEDKLEIVSLLKKQREKQLLLFDGMTDLIVPERMWLESFKTSNDNVTIKGVAFDNPTIADFMEKLEKSILFSKVDLKTAQMRKFKNDVMLKSFELLCVKAKPKPVEKEALKQGRK
ncbi:MULTISPECIES: PilN domain-containing protein [Desulfobacula]|uniref:PilN: fimbrial assembly protein n=2 Tax=Desulfobacula TaxID=28222 RepID=K0NG43_DESTT|nr:MULTISPECIES: PilN domain-containing protein [Desulfobacula]CCK78753.1 PilN: fimbrial assembly protein [Desulfobacula toluolica Tol2]SDT87156.1 type IV pilus assembly protein PilN [Desulfobacula phenolica]